MQDVLQVNINVKYLDPDMPKIKIIEKGDWIDLVNVEDVRIYQHEHKYIRLGVIIQLPEDYEALLLPRSSTFKKFGILIANSMGVIDNSYRGPEDEWMLSAYNPNNYDVTIPKYTRIAQFRIIENQPKINIIEIDEVTDDSRGGFGSTGN